ncbi:unnamed protein product [Oppiella nova]|uniref:Uncharacterized protein n=1 Tax=Oppiella nova TaxID=334625 RepID=A0A7R9QQ86_9ACAR|nr:unnamed protein product [Oppiella nova]CAG2171030.1 unnamed protein product [Oppiella nova]
MDTKCMIAIMSDTYNEPSGEAMGMPANGPHLVYEWMTGRDVQSVSQWEDAMAVQHRCLRQISRELSAKRSPEWLLKTNKP